MLASAAFFVIATGFAGFSDFANNTGCEVVGVRGFTGEISEAQWRESRKSNGFSLYGFI